MSSSTSPSSSHPIPYPDTASSAFSVDTDKDHSEHSAKETEEDIAKNEDRMIRCLRWLMFFVLAGTAVFVSLSVYFYLRAEEDASFEDQFASDAAKVLEEMGKSLDNTMGPADALVVNYLAYGRSLAAQKNGTAFPFVSLPSYGVQAAKLVRISKAFQIFWAIKVEVDELQAWKEYADESHEEWIEDALDVLESDPDWAPRKVFRDYSRCYNISGWVGADINDTPDPTVGFFMPNWMEYPIMSGAAGNGGCPYNFDYTRLPEIAAGINYMKATQKAVIGNFPIVNFEATDPRKKLLTDLVRQFVPENVDPAEPYTQLVLPILDGAVDSLYVNISQPQIYRGHLALQIQFRALIENILPEQSNGIVIVADQGSCGVPFTYQIDGARVTYLGVGDHHDSQYDSMVHKAVLEELLDASKTDRDSTYTGLPVSSEFCPIYINIYPSQAMEENHHTSNPIVMTMVAIGIFIFTSAVILTYDMLVTRRQKIVMNRAIESGAIVSSLFPEEVRKKLYEENKQKFQNEERRKNMESNKTWNQPGEQRNEGVGSDSIIADANQIAKSYPETTIFFADLSGFTKWSSSREPAAVFKLLETLFGAFDVIAKQRRVFKVETIGDCYVAITGCPSPQKLHAVTMVRFARDCMNKMNDLTHDLAETLGEDTASLGFRVGLHSGPVTAGVLRGQKARFQLFGDSVNTASRMESNGVVGRIHVSQATADALTAAGKGSWLTQRPDRIVAKGKGEMITYFVSIRPLTSRSSGSMSGDDDDGDHVKAVDDAAVQQDCRRQDVTSSIFVDV